MMRSTLVTYLLSLTAAAVAHAQSGPAISVGGVVSAATYAPLGGPNAGIAQGSFFSVYGSGIGPATPVTATTLPLQTALGASSVTVTPLSGPPVQAYVDFVDSGQINAILPSGTATGPATVTVTYNGATSTPANINVVANSFGIFTAAYGSGPAATINRTVANPYNQFTNAANPGNILELYGTGLGPISVPDNNLPGAVTPPNVSVQVLIGNETVTPLYAGRSPALVGVDQIDFTVPNDVPASCFVPVAIVVNGIASNFGTLSTAGSGSNCAPPFGLTPDKLESLANGGTLTGGFLNVSTITTQVSTNGITISPVTEQAGAVFARLDAEGLLGLEQTLGGVPPVNPPGTCIVETIKAPNPPQSATPAVPNGQLNAGAQLQLSGPSGNMNIPFNNGSYTTVLKQGQETVTYVTPGTWTMTGSGGADIGPFTATINIPTALTCTNCSSLTTIDRTKPLTIQWTGGGGAQDWVEVAGISTAPLIADTTQNVASVFLCAGHASDQSLTVPANILAQLPAVGSNPISATYGTIGVINLLGSNNSFTAPLIAGGNMDLSFLNYSSVFLRVVGFN